MRSVSVSSCVDEKQGRQHIFIDVVGKPLDFGQFMDALNQALGERVHPFNVYLMEESNEAQDS